MSFIHFVWTSTERIFLCFVFDCHFSSFFRMAFLCLCVCYVRFGCLCSVLLFLVVGVVVQFILTVIWIGAWIFDAADVEWYLFNTHELYMDKATAFVPFFCSSSVDFLCCFFLLCSGFTPNDSSLWNGNYPFWGGLEMIWSTIAQFFLALNGKHFRQEYFKAPVFLVNC